MKRTFAIALVMVLAISLLAACSVIGGSTNGGGGGGGGGGQDIGPGGVNNSGYDEDGNPMVYIVRYDPGAYGWEEAYESEKYFDEPYMISYYALFYRPGYRQTGWALTDGGAKDFDLEGMVSINHDFTLYPYWELGVGTKDTPFDDCFFSIYEPHYEGSLALYFEKFPDDNPHVNFAENPTSKFSTSAWAIYKPGYYYTQNDRSGERLENMIDGWIHWDIGGAKWFFLPNDEFPDGVCKEYGYMNGGAWLETKDFEPGEMESEFDQLRNGFHIALNTIIHSGTHLDGSGTFERTGSGEHLGRDCAIFRKDMAFNDGYDEYWLDKESGFCMKQITELTAEDDYIHNNVTCTRIVLGDAVDSLPIPPVPTQPDYFDMEDE
ncbi:MAG: hypothetical protein FWE59_04745 [Oscillospiraceae bacterium]|nr:hypothetical protein [Oscillospiraceae bacterium]